MTGAPIKEAVSKGAWYALSVLTLIYVFNSVDRYIMSIAAESVKLEFGISDSQLGLVTGLAFGLTYAIAGVPIGILVDRVHRIKLLSFMVFVWSGATALCGVAQNFAALVAARLTVGAAESAGAPSSLSIISDLFPKTRRSTAIGVFWFSTAVGTSMSLILGALVVHHYGWRAAFFIAGLPGLLAAALLLLSVKEPARERLTTRTEQAPQFFTTLRFITKTPIVLHAFAGLTLNAIAMTSVPAWAASFLVRTQGLSLVDAGLLAGLGVGLFGGLGSLLGGPLGDYVARRFGLNALPLVPMAASVLAMASGLAFALSPHLAWLVAGFVVFEIVTRGHTPPAYNILLSNVQPRMRGVVVSTVQAATNLIGYGAGPLIVGVVSDLVGGDLSLRIGVAAVMVFPLWAALHFFGAWRASCVIERAKVAGAERLAPELG